MIVRVSTMGPLRRIAPVDDEKLDVPENATVGHAIDALLAKYPAIAPHRSSVLAAMNEEWVDLDRVVIPNSSLILMPPVSGG